MEILKVVVIGGGTFNHISCHLALAAPAFGATARKLVELFKVNRRLEPQLVLTKMADHTSDLITNEDVERYIVDVLLPDEDVRAIVMNAAICDFSIDNPGETRLSSAKDYPVVLKGIQGKIMAIIKEVRPDIIVVGFKTTHGAQAVEQVAKAFTAIHNSGVDIVLANDVGSRTNIMVNRGLNIKTGHRHYLLEQLVEDVIDYVDIKAWIG